MKYLSTAIAHCDMIAAVPDRPPAKPYSSQPGTGMLGKSRQLWELTQNSGGGLSYKTVVNEEWNQEIHH